MIWKQPKNWRWMDGMLVEWDPPRGASGQVIYSTCARLTQLPEPMNPAIYGVMDYSDVPSGRNIRPVLTDPATLGCLLALVREAWGDEGISTVRAYAPDMCGQWSVHSHRGGKQLPHKRYPTEAESLLAALEAAP